jgi:hypothetical protein
MADPNKGPQWQSPRKPIPAADKPKPEPRDYIGPALAAVRTLAGPVRAGQESIVAAIIIAQALDRFGEKLIDAAAVSQYKRGP